MYVKQIATVGLAAGSVIWASSAGAETITIGSTINGAHPVASVSGTTTAKVEYTQPEWQPNIASGLALGAGLDILDSNSINASLLGTSNTLQIFITASNLTSPFGLNVPFISGFTSNTLPSGMTVTEETIFNPDNVPLEPDSASSIIGSHTFTDAGTAGQTTVFPSVNTPFSVTELYDIASNGVGGTANSTINLSTVPLPGTLPFFASGLGVLGLLGWRRNRKAPRSIFPR
jgi:hypothetical protein